MRKTLAKGGQQGFTLIELVVVIVILGILAATALPRFANLQSSSRLAALNGMVGALNSAMAIAHAQALVSAQTGSTGTITMDGGASVALVYGYPDASTGGIGAAVTSSGFAGTFGTAGAASAVATYNFATTVTGCNVTYTAASSTGSGASAVVTPPSAALVNTGNSSC